MIPRKNRITQAVLVVLVFILVTAAWQIFVRVTDTPAYTLPAPSDIGEKLLAMLQTPSFWRDVWVTLQETFWGFLLSIVIAVTLGVLISQFYTLELSLLPYIVAFQTIPSIALAPIYLYWFGYGMAPKIALAVTISCFPIMINVIAGLQSTNAEQLQMLRAFGASRMQILLKLSIPNAMPHFFTGLRLGIIMSLTGALVAEFVGASAGLGLRILQYEAQAKIADMFGVLIALGVMGILAYALISCLRKKVVFWEDPHEYHH
jgi:NitT/TauT family transport system permease protein